MVVETRQARPGRRQMTTLAYILTSGLLGVAGQIILKQGITALGLTLIRLETLPSIVLAMVFNPVVLAGLGVYASGTFFWLLALSRVDLSYAYPFASLNYVLVLFGSWWFLGEQPSAMRLVGVLAICLGVWAVSRTPAQTASRTRPQRFRSRSVVEEGKR